MIFFDKKAAETDLSVCIPVYNVGKYLKRFFESLFCHSENNHASKFKIEYIFVDDASSDDSFLILRELIDKLPETKQNEIKILRHTENRGVAAARKSAFEKARGKYIICYDSDDWIEPDACLKMLEYAIDGHYDIVECGYFRDFDEVPSHLHNPKQYKNKNDYIHGLLKGEILGTLWSRIWKRELLADIDVFYSDDVSYCEDLLLFMQVLLRSQSFAFINIPLYHYCKNSVSITANMKHSHFVSGQKVLNYFLKILPNEYHTDIYCAKLSLLWKCIEVPVLSNAEFKISYRQCKPYFRYNNLPKIKAVILRCGDFLPYSAVCFMFSVFYHIKQLLK